MQEFDFVTCSCAIASLTHGDAYRDEVNDNLSHSIHQRRVVGMFITLNNGMSRSPPFKLMCTSSFHVPLLLSFVHRHLSNKA